jgi:hypothetical protein
MLIILGGHKYSELITVLQREEGMAKVKIHFICVCSEWYLRGMLRLHCLEGGRPTFGPGRALTGSLALFFVKPLILYYTLERLPVSFCYILL